MNPVKTLSMNKISIKLLAHVSLIITATVVGTPLASHAAPEVAAWGMYTTTAPPWSQ